MIVQGLMEVLQPMTIALIAIGTVVGIIFGSIPGLTATMAIVMFLPVTYSMTASEGISMLMALYIGGISGGLISAILLNIPGTPSSVPPVLMENQWRTRARQQSARHRCGVLIYWNRHWPWPCLWYWLLCCVTLRLSSRHMSIVPWRFSLSMVVCPYRT